VVIQGTDTVEETAYLLDLAHHDPRPLVVTGAMRNPTLAGPDGPANLLAAVQVAASTSAFGPEARRAVEAEAALPTTRWDEEVARSLDLGLPRVNSIVDKRIPTFSRGELPHFGVGHVPDRVVEPLARLASAMPVVLASRTGAGPVLARTYALPGSESDLLGRGLIGAGFLDPSKARILLHQLLASGADHAASRGVFATAGGDVEASDEVP